MMILLWDRSLTLLTALILKLTKYVSNKYRTTGYYESLSSLMKLSKVVKSCFKQRNLSLEIESFTVRFSCRSPNKKHVEHKQNYHRSKNIVLELGESLIWRLE